MSSFTYSVEFAASPATIWPYLEDPDKIRQWMTGVIEDRPTSEGPPRLGSTFEFDMREGGKLVTYEGEITKYEKHRLMGVRMVGGCGKKPMTMHADYRLIPLSADRTRLDYAFRCEPLPGLVFKLMSPFFKLMGKSMIKKFMRNLRGLVEAPAQATAGA